jgi:hypothetical protein
VKAPPRSPRALVLHRLGLAAVVLAIEIAAAWLLGGLDPGAKLLAGGSSAVLAVFVLGAFFCLRFLAYFVVPPALAVGIVAALLPKGDLREAVRALRLRWSRNDWFGRLG